MLSIWWHNMWHFSSFLQTIVTKKEKKKVPSLHQAGESYQAHSPPWQLCVCSTRSIFPRHTSPPRSLCIPQCQGFFFYGAINARRKNREGWFCGWVGGGSIWVRVGTEQGINHRETFLKFNHIGDIYSMALKHSWQTGGETWPWDLTEQLCSC